MFLSSIIFSRWYQKPPEYPVRIIQSVLHKKSTPFLGFFDKEDTVAASSVDTDDTTISSVGTRLAPINRADEFTNICPDETHYIYPRRGTNKKGKN